MEWIYKALYSYSWYKNEERGGGRERMGIKRIITNCVVKETNEKRLYKIGRQN